MTQVVYSQKNQIDVYIGRPSQWGNPFEIGKDGDRETVIEKYIAWFFTQDHLLRDIPKLKDKVLSCWCSPLDCHGDFLAGFIDGYVRGGTRIPLSEAKHYYKKGINLANRWRYQETYEFKELMSNRNFPHKLKIARELFTADKKICALCLGISVNLYNRLEEEPELRLTPKMQRLLVFHTDFKIKWFLDSVAFTPSSHWHKRGGKWDGGSFSYSIDLEAEYQEKLRLKNSLKTSQELGKVQEGEALKLLSGTGEIVGSFSPKTKSKQLRLFD